MRAEDIEYGIPPEVWQHVSLFLQPRDLVHLACTSQTMRAAVLPDRVLGCKPFKVPWVFLAVGGIVSVLILITTILPIWDYLDRNPEVFWSPSSQHVVYSVLFYLACYCSFPEIKFILNNVFRRRAMLDLYGYE